MEYSIIYNKRREKEREEKKENVYMCVCVK